MTRSKAFFINGGAGRMICSIPAFEKYEEESGDKDFIIVCEGGTDVYKGHPKLDHSLRYLAQKPISRQTERHGCNYPRAI